MTSAVEHHAEMARYAREEVATFRAYLDWSTDPDQRAWAEAKAKAAEIDAEAEETYAEKLQARQQVPA